MAKSNPNVNAKTLSHPQAPYKILTKNKFRSNYTFKQIRIDM